MAIRFACPHCGRNLKAADAAVGKSLACPKCSRSVVVPTPLAARGAGDAVSPGGQAEPAGASDEDAFAPHRSGRTWDDELDMTPMVDVTFLLLIFFMVTAAYALQKAINVSSQQDEVASQSNSVDDEDKNAITIRVDRDNVYWIGGPGWPQEHEAASVQEMFVQLRLARAADRAGPARMIVLANGSATHERVVAALDAGAEVGMEDVRLVSFEDGDL